MKSKSLIPTLMAVAFMFVAGLAQARPVHHHRVPVRPAPRQCFPLPDVATPITNQPTDPNAYCEAPWLNPDTVYYTCADRLTQLNAYALCHEECGPTHDSGGGMWNGNCTGGCLARYCQQGR